MFDVDFPDSTAPPTPAERMETEEAPLVEHVGSQAPVEVVQPRLPPPPEPYYSYNAPLAAQQKELANLFSLRFMDGKLRENGALNRPPFPLLLEITRDEIATDKDNSEGKKDVQIDVKLPTSHPRVVHGNSALAPLRHSVPSQQAAFGPYSHSITPETYEKSIFECVYQSSFVATLMWHSYVKDMPHIVQVKAQRYLRSLKQQPLSETIREELKVHFVLCFRFA